MVLSGAELIYYQIILYVLTNMFIIFFILEFFLKLFENLSLKLLNKWLQFYQ